MSLKSKADIVGDKAEKKRTGDKKLAKEITVKEFLVFRLVTNFPEKE